MRAYRFRVVNVFAESTFGGNPLAVVEDAGGLSDAEMAAIADQFNLSETTFVLPAVGDTEARVRIFSPGYEMPFAGHPTLGTAFVLSQQRRLGARFTLELNVGPITVEGAGDTFRLRAAKAVWSACDTPPADLAAMLGLSAAELDEGPRHVSAGTHKLLVPLRSVEAVHACKPRLGLLERFARNADGRIGVYVFARTAAGFVSRFFWEHQGLVREDPGTGSACAALGGFWIASGAPLPFEARIEQGHALGRLNVLQLRVDADQSIWVGGRVVPLMEGTLSLP